MRVPHELAIRLQREAADLHLYWLPRLQNQEADQLTNYGYTRFDPAKRLRLDWAQYKGMVLRDMLDHGMELYAEIREARAMKKARLEAKVATTEQLRIRDPWQ